ncbi:MAG: cysteine-S-conjugate beta-lyase [Clostridiales bacterium]|nr:cysteine-S-conjugate beta-lyase [Clostridiales bacterium]
MTYDFETLVKRKNTGSVKWNQMYEAKPDISDEIVPFSVADMELRNPPEIIEGLKKFLDESILGYTTTTDAYYESVLGWMERKHGFRPKREWCIETSGVVPALSLMVKAFTKPGDEVLIMTPVYYPFRKVAVENGRAFVESKLMEENGRYQIDFDDFEEKAKRLEVKLFILCSPHNPVGRVWTKEELHRIAQICYENNVFILDDEIHFDLILPGYEHVSMGTFETKYLDNCAICTAPSKTFNLAGMQVSNIFIANDEKRESLRKVMGFSLLNVMGMKACEIAYNECEEWLSRLLLLIDENRRMVEEFLKEKLPMIKTYPLEGTYLLWMDFRALGLKDKDLEALMTKEADLFFDEGYIFGDGGSGFERMNLACPRHIISAALERLYASLVETNKLC